MLQFTDLSFNLSTIKEDEMSPQIETLISEFDCFFKSEFIRKKSLDQLLEILTRWIKPWLDKLSIDDWKTFLLTIDASPELYSREARETLRMPALRKKYEIISHERLSAILWCFDNPGLIQRFGVCEINMQIHITEGIVSGSCADISEIEEIIGIRLFWKLNSILCVTSTKIKDWTNVEFQPELNLIISFLSKLSSDEWKILVAAAQKNQPLIPFYLKKILRKKKSLIRSRYPGSRITDLVHYIRS